MSEVEYRAAWRRRDPGIERDAELFWQRRKVRHPKTDVSARLARLCAAAYWSNELIATSVANVRAIDFLNCKLAMYSCYVGHEWRSRHIGTDLTIFSRDLLEQWARDNPNEGVLGVGAVIRSRELVERQDQPVYPRTKLSLIGYTSRGFQMRVFWFAHARIPKYWPGWTGKTPEDTEDDDDDV